MPARTANTTPPASGETDALLRAELGGAIRKLRKERGLTLVQLAERAELSHPFLSQLERGLTRPSMPSLHRIARALGTTQQALMATASVPHSDGPTGTAHLVRAGAGLPVTNTGGTARMLGTPAYSFHPVEYTGVGEVFADFYDHPGDEFVYVIAGEIEIELRTDDAGGLHRLGPGDSIHYPGGTSHRWRAVGDGSQVRLLTVQNATGEADHHG
ncbi:helix-turn-helix domain-containing protein [Streptomyces griseorubiginosus]|uniref:helix-turn-helix domain-containing protein n=1 Tax=Streptomyces griseorubiginosus TaxID=67304 RepID=UPI001AD6AE76|nr:XRE family transcriptional regulator [Streptomyces griseorubiginosus]MBO4254083.1 helix-turn-helix domain-containing protein [Streptomyces griseorubiginosus]